MSFKAKQSIIFLSEKYKSIIKQNTSLQVCCQQFTNRKYSKCTYNFHTVYREYIL